MAELAKHHGVAGTSWTSPAPHGNGEKKGIFQCEHLAAPGAGLKSWTPAGKGTRCMAPAFPPYCRSRPEGDPGWLAQGNDGLATASPLQPWLWHGHPKIVIKMLRQH